MKKPNLVSTRGAFSEFICQGSQKVISKDNSVHTVLLMMSAPISELGCGTMMLIGFTAWVALG